jgi:hypothetical protein
MSFCLAASAKRPTGGHLAMLVFVVIPSYRMEQAKKNRDAGLESAEAK